MHELAWLGDGFNNYNMSQYVIVIRMEGKGRGVYEVWSYTNFMPRLPRVRAWWGATQCAQRGVGH